MDISSAASSLFSSSSRYGDQKKPAGDASAFLAMLNGGANPLSSLQVQTPGIDGLPVQNQPTIDGLPVEREVQIDGLPVEPGPEPDGLPVEPPEDPYVDPQILLTQKLAASLIGGWGTIEPPAAAA